MTRNEILYALNKPDDFILAIVVFGEDSDQTVHYVRKPFGGEPDFDETGRDYKLAGLIKRAEAPA